MTFVLLDHVRTYCHPGVGVRVRSKSYSRRFEYVRSVLLSLPGIKLLRFGRVSFLVIYDCKSSNILIRPTEGFTGWTSLRVFLELNEKLYSDKLYFLVPSRL